MQFRAWAPLVLALATVSVAVAKGPYGKENISTPPPLPQKGSVVTAPGQNSPVVGEWRNGASGSVYKQYGGFERYYNSGETYHFKPDGTFQWSMVSMGSVGVNGVAIITGRYSVQGNVIRFSNSRSSWRNDEDRADHYENRPSPDCDGDYKFGFDEGFLVIDSPTAASRRFVNQGSVGGHRYYR